MHHAHTGRIVTQSFAGMAGGMQQQIFRRTTGDNFAARIAALGAQVDQPVAGANNIQIVFNHQQRMPSV